MSWKWRLQILFFIQLITCLQCQHFLFEPPFQNALDSYRRHFGNQDVTKAADFDELVEVLYKVLENPYEAVFKSGLNVSLNVGCLTTFMTMDKNKRIQYIDAIGKPGAGVMQGNLQWYGSYDTCMDIQDAHYCSIRNINIKLGNMTESLTLYGICAPNTCNLNDVETILRTTFLLANTLVNHTVLILNDTTARLPSTCFNRNRDYTTGAKVMLFISGLILCLCFFGTATELLEEHRKKPKFDIPYTRKELDGQEMSSKALTDDKTNESPSPPPSSHLGVIVKENDNTFVDFMLCFSIIRNSKAILNTKVPKGSINCINGIRTISITWVMLGHLISVVFGGDNVLYIFKNWMHRFSTQGLANAFVSVDSFFVLSGLLVGYLSLRRFETHGKLPLLRYYVHRYIRLTASYAFLIFFVTYVYPYLHHGPNWVEEPDKNCRDYWWTNLLYINNIYPKQQHICYGVSWYLANDMQFYVISPIILYVMYKWKWMGVLVGTFPFFLEYILANGLIVGLNNESPILIRETMGNFMAKNDPVGKYFKDVYFKPWTRFAPYLVGIILGYILFYQKQLKKCIPTLVFYLYGWLVAIAMGMLVVYGPYTAAKGYVWNTAETITYAIFFRIAWAVALSWLIYACHTGYGGLINDFLSWKAFIPLSRLTYGVYLIHMYVIQFYSTTSQTPLHVTEITVTFLFIPIIVISYMLSYLVAVFIEYPVFNLEKMFLKF